MGKAVNDNFDDLEVRVGINLFDPLFTSPPLCLSNQEGIQAAQLIIQEALEFCREQQLLSEQLLLIGDAESD